VIGKGGEVIFTNWIKTAIFTGIHLTQLKNLLGCSLGLGLGIGLLLWLWLLDLNTDANINRLASADILITLHITLLINLVDGFVSLLFAKVLVGSLKFLSILVKLRSLLCLWIILGWWSTVVEG